MREQKHIWEMAIVHAGMSGVYSHSRIVVDCVVVCVDYSEYSRIVVDCVVVCVDYSEYSLHTR